MTKLYLSIARVNTAVADSLAFRVAQILLDASNLFLVEAAAARFLEEFHTSAARAFVAFLVARV